MCVCVCVRESEGVWAAWRYSSRSKRRIVSVVTGRKFHVALKLLELLLVYSFFFIFFFLFFFLSVPFQSFLLVVVVVVVVLQ